MELDLFKNFKANKVNSELNVHLFQSEFLFSVINLNEYVYGEIKTCSERRIQIITP